MPLNYPRFVLTNCDTGERFATVATAGAETLFEALDRSQLPIDQRCGGSSACGKCVVVVQEGWESLPPAASDELELLAEVAPDEPHARLACRVVLPPDVAHIGLCTAYWERDAEGLPLPVPAEKRG